MNVCILEEHPSINLSDVEELLHNVFTAYSNDMPSSPDNGTSRHHAYWTFLHAFTFAGTILTTIGSVDSLPLPVIYMLAVAGHNARRIVHGIPRFMSTSIYVFKNICT